MEDKNSLLKREIEEIFLCNKPLQTGITIPIFPNKTFNVYEVPIDYLKFNPYNDRIASYIKSYEHKNENNNIDWFSNEGQEIISNFLWESDIKGNEKSQEDIKRNKQHTFAIINKEGLVIDGNRRLCILKKICSEINHQNFDINSFNKLKTIVIQESLKPIEIMRLETAIQMGQDEKLDYQPIEKYLKVNKLLKQEIKEKEIASLMNKKLQEIEDYKKIYITMKNYLIFINAPNQFEFIKKFEDHFIKLTATLDAMKNRKYKTNWKFDEIDINDFQLIAFYFIRSGYEGKKFRKLLGGVNSKNGPFSNYKMWIDFKEEINLMNNKIEKKIMNRKDLVKKRDQEDLYQQELEKQFEKILKKKTDILEIENNGFKGQSLMNSCLSYIIEINDIFEETNITPNFKKDFNKIKELIFLLDKKLLEKGNK